MSAVRAARIVEDIEGAIVSLRKARTALNKVSALIGADNGETDNIANACGALTLVTAALVREHEAWTGYEAARLDN
jgi:hypothetical protein